MAGVFSSGGERAADAGKGVKVGVCEAVVAGNGSEGRIFGVPWAESAARGDFPFGLGVGERTVKIEWLSVADIFQDEVVDFKIERILASFFRQDDESCVVANDFVEEDARDGRGFLSGRRRGVGIAGRNGDDHILDVDTFDMARNVDDAENAEVEREARDLN